MLEVGTKPRISPCRISGASWCPYRISWGKRSYCTFIQRTIPPGCTRQACAFGANYAGFQSLNAVVIGVSKDSVASHVKFAEKYNLPFILLADPSARLLNPTAYGRKRSSMGKHHGVVRATYIIDEQGMVKR